MEKEEIGINIKKMRIKKGWTQAKLAKECGMYESQIRKYESGKVKPKIDTLGKISNALGISITKLDPSILDLSEITMDVKIDDDNEQTGLWWHEIEKTLEKEGYSVVINKDIPYFYLNYPDGTIELDNEKFRELNASILSYIKFQFEELKKQHIDKLKPYKDLPF